MARPERLTETHPFYDGAELCLGPQHVGPVLDPREPAFSGSIVQAIQFVVEKMDPSRRHKSYIVTISGDRIEWPEIIAIYDRYGIGSFVR